MISSYKFGEMKIKDKTYTSDLIISPSGIKDNWWRKEGHKLFLSDIEDYLTPDIKRLVIGCGAYGVLKVEREVEDFCKSKNVEIFAKDTKKAVDIFNQSKEKTIGAFHITC